MLVIKDKISGYMSGRLCKNQTSQSAYGTLLPWFYSYGIPQEVFSDGGSSFRDSFTRKLEKLGINHTLTSQYNRQSNGGAERTVHSLKEVWKKRELRKRVDRRYV